MERLISAKIQGTACDGGFFCDGEGVSKTIRIELKLQIQIVIEIFPCFFIKCRSISVVVGYYINGDVFSTFHASFWTRFDHRSVVILELPRLHFSGFLRTFWIFHHSVVVGSVVFRCPLYSVSARVVVGWPKNMPRFARLFQKRCVTK